MIGREYTGAALYIGGVKVADVESCTIGTSLDVVPDLPLVGSSSITIETTIAGDDARRMFDAIGAMLRARRRRVRWERHRSIAGERVVLYVDGVRFGEANRFRGEREWFVGVDDTDVYDYVPRRSDAKRWLLARAAGLAEVPRGVRPFAMWARGTEGGRGYRIEAGALVPRGWRRAGARGAIALLADGTTTRVDHVERNRRRR